MTPPIENEMRVDALRFIDSRGFAWQVSEVPLADGRAGQGWLYFFSRGSTRVLRDYPSNWGGLSWKEIETLRDRGAELSSDVTRAVRPVTVGVPGAVGAA
jgi:hypothetical protein